MPHAFARLVRPAGICPIPSLDWFTSLVYAPSSRSIGSRRWYIPHPLARLVRPAGICPIPSLDWSAPQLHAASAISWGELRSASPRIVVLYYLSVQIVAVLSIQGPRVRGLHRISLACVDILLPIWQQSLKPERSRDANTSHPTRPSQGEVYFLSVLFIRIPPGDPGS